METIQRKPVHLAQVVKDVLATFEKSDLKQYGKIFLHWKEIAGSDLSPHTRPESVRGKKLKVVVDSSEWLYEIHHRYEKDILESVQKWVGEDLVKEVRYVVGDDFRNGES